MRLRTSTPEGSAHVKTGGDRSREHSPAQASGSQTGRAQHSGGDKDLPRPLPVGSTHHGGAPVRLPQLTGPRRPDCPAQLTDQALRWRKTKTRELANPRGPAPAPGCVPDWIEPQSPPLRALSDRRWHQSVAD